MRAVPKVQSLEECIKHHNLFLIHIGHSWIIMRVTGADSAEGGAIPLSELVTRLPPAAMIGQITKIEDVAMLNEWITAARVSPDTLCERLNKPLDPSGYEEVTGRKQFM